MTRIDEAIRRLKESGSQSAAAVEHEVVQFPPNDLWISEDRQAAPAAVELPIEEPAPVVPPRVQPAVDPIVEPPSSVPEELQEKVVSTSRSAGAAIEEYRRLAARLHLAQAERGIRTVMVASAAPSEGKTLTATNLALTLSQSYKREVLLVDADLRHPSLHQMFGVANVTGLNDGINDQVDRKVPLNQVRPHLTLLTAGRPERDPMGVFTSERMRRVLDEAKRRFDWVIVDTPPVGLLTDAKLMAAYVDVVVFVIHAGVTPATGVQYAIQAIGREKVFGVVLNRIAKGSNGTNHYYPYVEKVEK